MPGTSDQWRALDRQNERLVDASGPHAPAVTAAVSTAEAHPAEADPGTGRPAPQPVRGVSRQPGQHARPSGPDTGSQPGRDAGLSAIRPAGRHRARGTEAAAVAALAIAG